MDSSTTLSDKQVSSEDEVEQPTPETTPVKEKSKKCRSIFPGSLAAKKRKSDQDADAEALHFGTLIPFMNHEEY